jgi:hypothetical protein
MQHRGVRYVIRIGIERERWRVAIHPPGNVLPKGLPKEKTVLGTREDAEIIARSMIDAWLRKRRRQHFDAGAK